MNYAVYLDGVEVHDSDLRMKKDALIVEALERRGFAVDRFRYHPPISNKRVREIADAVEEHMKGLI